MRSRKRPPLFIDLDECLVHAREISRPDAVPPLGAVRLFRYDIYLRPETPELLQLCRDGGREVYLFTMANFGFALTVAQTYQLGFTENTIFSMAMILNCRRGLCPGAVLIDNKAPSEDTTQEKMAALGIASDAVWVIPAYEHPRFASAKPFLMGLPLRLARFDRQSRG